MKKVKLFFTMVAVCATLSFVSNLQNKPSNADMTHGITYDADETRESNVNF